MSSDPLIWQLLLQVVLIAINAFFAMTEIAVIQLNESKVQKMAEEGDKGAKKLLYLTENPARFLSTIQVAITLAGFLGSAFAASNLAQRISNAVIEAGSTMNPATIETLAVIGVTLILSYFTLVFGELVPKRIAQKKPEAVARKVAGVIRAVSAITKPIVWLLTKSTNGVLRLLGLDPNDDGEDVSEDDIRMMVDIGEEKGAIGAEEREMIDNIFDFNDTTASDLMIHRTDTMALWVDEAPEELERQISESGFSRFPVYDEDMDDIIGILYLRDYFINLRSKKPKPLREILRTPYFVPDSVKADVLFREMQSRQVHMALVVDEYGGFSGIVTMEDLLEEIVGNIYDEFDPVEKEMEQLEDGSWHIRGSVDLDTISEVFHLDLPVDEYDTLGGMIFGVLGAIPDDGQRPELEAFGLHIWVELIEDRRVEWARVMAVADMPAAEQSADGEPAQDKEDSQKKGKKDDQK